MNRRDANLQLARRYPGGIRALAQRLGKRPDSLRKALTGVQNYKLDILEEERIVRFCLDAGVANPLAPITAAAANAGAVLLPVPMLDDAVQPTLRHMAQAARDFAQFAASLADAEADGVITPNERLRIEREGGRLIAAIQLVIMDVEREEMASRQARMHSARRLAARDDDDARRTEDRV